MAKPNVFFDMSIGGKPAGRIVMELKSKLPFGYSIMLVPSLTTEMTKFRSSSFVGLFNSVLNFFVWGTQLWSNQCFSNMLAGVSSQSESLDDQKKVRQVVFTGISMKAEEYMGHTMELKMVQDDPSMVTDAVPKGPL
ncbi:hypothetical protein MAR_028188 [Mya arenaria]|uniref:Uncharacterized protein n=1 Tax=Mya arenaria TaxID=6604 RepID=A0ABY7DF03_MYAAR|nr:hypothetical protein MAR_028188 [Mya arenaria]